MKLPREKFVECGQKCPECGTACRKGPEHATPNYNSMSCYCWCGQCHQFWSIHAALFQAATLGEYTNYAFIGTQEMLDCIRAEDPDYNPQYIRIIK